MQFGIVHRQNLRRQQGRIGGTGFADGQRGERSMLALPIFTCSRPHTIVGTHELNFCVRNGNRWTLMAINTNYLPL